MKRASIIFLLALPLMILGFGKGRQLQDRTGYQAQKAVMANRTETPPAPKEAKRAPDAEVEMKAMLAESIRKKGDIEPRVQASSHITPERQQMTGVNSIASGPRSHEKVIRIVGRVNYDDKRTTTVAANVGGRIEDLYVGSFGGYVRRGEPLLSIHSAEMVAAQEEYLIALRAKEEFSKSPFPEVARSGESLAESAKRRLNVWNISDEQIRTLEETHQIQKTFNIYAPKSGYFLENQAYKGMSVVPETHFKLADLSVVSVISDINESDLPFVWVGQQAPITSDAIPGETFTGKAIYVYPSNRETHVAKVRFEISNPKGQLKPEMRANLEIKVNLGRESSIANGATAASPGFAESDTRDALVGSYDQTSYDTLIVQLSKKYKVDFHLIKAIIRMESGFNPYAVSKKGARGLMQLMPETAEQMNVTNIFDPKENIEGGIRYLKYLGSIFNNDLTLSLAAYNAGEKMVVQFKGIPPYPETVDYVKKVMALYRSYKS